MKQETLNIPIHVARIQPKGREPVYLFLREIHPGEFRWLEGERATEVFAESKEEAIRLAWRYWKPGDNAFRMLHCGYWFTLPEREEHGVPALFHQMTASYSTPMGVYFDEEYGHQAIVREASDEALDLWRDLRNQAGSEDFPKLKR